MKTEASAYQFLVTPAVSTRGSITTTVTETLRRAIISLEMKPGAPIDKTAVCERLGVSRFPVSEALSRLRAEGLVDIQPQRGSIVSLVRVADVLECMLIRRALECEAVEILAAGAHPELITGLEQSIASQRAATEANDLYAFHIEDVRFHEQLFESLRLPRLKGIIESARANLDRARQLVNTPHRLAVSIDQHSTIASAIARHDGKAAAAAMREHLDTVIVNIVAFAREQPDLFADGDEDFAARLASLFRGR